MRGARGSGGEAVGPRTASASTPPRGLRWSAPYSAFPTIFTFGFFFAPSSSIHFFRRSFDSACHGTPASFSAGAAREAGTPVCPRGAEPPHAPWHFLNFFPLPQWHGSLRP